MDKEALIMNRKSFGEKLKDLRESQGISLEGMAHSTRISLAFIQALEEGNFEKLPGQVFGRGFVKSLAKTMGASEAEWAKAFNDACGLEAGQKPFERSTVTYFGDGGEKTREVRKASRRAGRILSGKRRMFFGFSKFFYGLRFHGVIFGLLGAVTIACFLLVFLNHGGTEFLTQWEPGWIRKKVVSTSPAPEQEGEIGEIKVFAQEELTSWEMRWFQLWMPHRSNSEALVRSQIGMLNPFVLGTVPYEGPLTYEAMTKITNHIEGAPRGVEVSEKWNQLSGKKIHESAIQEGVFPDKGMEDLEKINSIEKSDIQEFSGLPVEPFAMQQLVLTVREPVKIKIGIDGDPMSILDLSVDQHQFKFKDRLDLLIYDASSLSVRFNGQDLGPLGQKGRIRRLTFKSHNDLSQSKNE